MGRTRRRLVAWRTVRRESLYQRFELFLLVRRQFRPDLLVDPLHFLAHLWGDICPNLAILLLPLGDDFLDGIMLCGCEFERVVKAFNKFLPQYFRRARSGKLFWTQLVMTTHLRMQPCSRKWERNIFQKRAINAINQQPAG